MAKFTKKPDTVDAYTINAVTPQTDGTVVLGLDHPDSNSATVTLAGMLGVNEPAVGDYWVVTSEGEAWQPKAYFEELYTPVA